MMWTFYTSLSFSTSLLHLVNMPCWTPKDLNLYLVIKNKEMKFIDTEYKQKWDIRHKWTTCRITKYMQQWFICLMRIFSTTYNKFRKIILSQHNPQIRITKLDYWSSLITCKDLFFRISIHLITQSTKSGQITISTWWRIHTSHWHLFITRRHTRRKIGIFD
jgi:hypothetical protein